MEKLVRFTLLLMVLISSTIYSNSITFSSKQKVVVDLFIAVYGRAPTQSGLDFWVNSIDKGRYTVKSMVEFMIDPKHNPEASIRFPTGKTSDMVEAVFKNVLGRGTATDEGRRYWSDRVDNEPNYGFDNLVLDVLNAAKNASIDKKTLDNRREVVAYFLGTIPSDKQAGKQPSLGGVTSDPSTVDKAKQAIDNYANSLDLNIINISNISNINQFNSDYIKKFPILKLNSIGIKEIGDAKRNYQLDKSKIKIDDLSDLGEFQADLSNKNSAIELESGKFYYINAKFNSQNSSSANFVFSLVSTDENNPLTLSLANASIGMVQDGDHEIFTRILVPFNIPEGEYLLIVAPINANLNSYIKEKKSITEIPEIGAIYVNVTKSSSERTGYVLDINTTKYIDLIYNDKMTNIFTNNYVKKASGKGKFVFSNIGLKDIDVIISAKLELNNGITLDLLLLDPNDKQLKSSVTLKIPHNNRNKIISLLNSKGIYIKPNNTWILNGGLNYKRLTPKISDTKELFDSGIGKVTAQHNFMPFSLFSVKGEKRYRATLSFYIKKDDYLKFINFVPDLSNNIKSSGLNGTVKWEVKILDKVGLKEVTDSLTNISKLEDSFVKPNNINLITKLIASPIIDKTIVAALDMKDGRAYVFNSNGKCAELDRKTGAIKGNWEDIENIFPGFTKRYKRSIRAAFRVNYKAFFIVNSPVGINYIAYDLDNNRVIYIDKISNYLKREAPLYSNISFIENIYKYLKTDKIDAAFNDNQNHVTYFIANNNYLKFYASTKNNRFNFVFAGDSINNKDEWSRVAGKKIIATLAGHTNSYLIRFFIDDIAGANKSTLIFNKSNLIVNKHNGLIKELGDSDVVSLKFKSNYGLEARWMVPQSRAYANAYLDFYLFSKKFSLFLAEADAYGGVNKINPFSGIKEATIKTGAKITLHVLNGRYIDEGSIKTIKVTQMLDSGTPQNNINSYPKKIFNNDILNWHEKVKLFDVRFPAGPIMLQVCGGVDGEMNIKSPIYLEEKGTGATLELKPSASVGVGVYADGGVNYELVRAGVEANVRLAEVGSSAKLSGSINLENNAIKFNINTSANANLNLIRSNFFLYAGTKTHIEWCSKWGIHYPCGLGWDDWTIPIYTTPWLYSKEIELFNKTLYKDSIPIKE